MRSKNVANEQKTEALTLGLGREKRGEEILRNGWRNAMTIVGDGECSRCGGFNGDKSLCRTDALHSILDDVDEYLLEKNGVKMNGYGFVGQTEVNIDVRLRTQVFEEGTAGFHLLAEVAELQLRLRNLYETNDERAASRSLAPASFSIFNFPFSIKLMMPATLLFTSWAIIRMTRS